MLTGKGLYIEGVDFGADNYNSQLYSYFGCSFLGTGNSSFYGNVSLVEGQPATIAEGKNYNYLYQEPPDHYVDEIDADEGTILFRDQTGIGRAISYSGPGNSYRVIHSTFLFGALRDSINTRTELMANYMQYLTQFTGIQDDFQPKPVNPNRLRNNPNPFSSVTKIYWNITSSCQVELKIFDCSGSLVKGIFYGKKDFGSYELTWDGKDNFGGNVKPGTYFIQLKTGSFSFTKAIVKTK